MSKVFFRTMYTMFLWIIVMINIIFFFDIFSHIPLLGATIQGDYSNKYFGMSSLISFIEGLNVEDDFPFLLELRSWIQNINSTMSKAIDETYSGFVWSVPITDIASFFTNVGLFFVGVFRFFSQVLIQISMVVFWVVYYSLYILGCYKVLLKLLTGAYFIDVPHSGIVMPSVPSAMLFMSTLV